MQRKIAKLSLAVTALILIISLTALAQAPLQITYQGRLADANGNPIAGPIDVVFSIYEAEAAFDGEVALGSETISVSPDDNGVFTVVLGETEPILPELFNGQVRYLGIKVGDDPEMTPRQPLSSVPYALKVAEIPTVIEGNKEFQGGNVYFGDSTMIINNTGIRVGSTIMPSSSVLLYLLRSYNHTSGYRYGLWSELSNSGTGGDLCGIFSRANVASGYSYGIYGDGKSDSYNRYGVYGSASRPGGTGAVARSYGLYGIASSGIEAFGVYGYASGASTNYAGYFQGNVTVTGSLSKGGGSFKIDHPLDPENKYLLHSFVESPDMMNIYNGNVITDDNGYATVILPDYFDALNRDFRYQLTVIGDFAQAIIAEEINNNQFAIRTDKPNVKVSWQVTGVRQDPYAEANRIQVEVEKPAQEKGLYLHPEAYQLPPEMQIHYKQNAESQQLMPAESGN